MMLWRFKHGVLLFLLLCVPVLHLKAQEDKTLFEGKSLTIYLDFSKSFLKNHNDNLGLLNIKVGRLIGRLQEFGLRQASVVNFDKEIRAPYIVENPTDFKGFTQVGEDGTETNLLKVLDRIAANPNEISLVLSDFIHESTNSKGVDAELLRNRAEFVDSFGSIQSQLRDVPIFLLEFPYIPVGKTSSSIVAGLPVTSVLNQALGKDGLFSKFTPQTFNDQSFIDAYRKMKYSRPRIISAYFSRGTVSQLALQVTNETLASDSVRFFEIRLNDQPYKIEGNAFQSFLSPSDAKVTVFTLDQPPFNVDQGSTLSVSLQYRNGGKPSRYSDLIDVQIPDYTFRDSTVTFVPGTNPGYGFSVLIDGLAVNTRPMFRLMETLPTWRTVTTMKNTNGDAPMILWSKLDKSDHGINRDKVDQYRFLVTDADGDAIRLGSFVQYDWLDGYVEYSNLGLLLLAIVVFCYTNYRQRDETLGARTLYASIAAALVPQISAAWMSVPSLFFGVLNWFVMSYSDLWLSPSTRIYGELFLSLATAFVLWTISLKMFVARRVNHTLEVEDWSHRSHSGTPAQWAEKQVKLGLNISFVFALVITLLILFLLQTPFR